MKYDSCIDTLKSTTDFTSEYIEKELELMQREYDISPSRYIKRKLYELPEEERYARAEKMRKNRRLEKKPAEFKGITLKEAKAEAVEGAQKYGISKKEYISAEYYRYSGREQELYHEYRTSFYGRKKKYRERIKEDTGWDDEKISAELKRAAKLFNISEREYYVNRLYGMSESRMALKVRKSRRREASNLKKILAIGNACDRTRAEIYDDLAYIRKKSEDFRPGLKWYYKSGIYNLKFPDDDTKLEDKIQQEKRRIELRKEIRNNITLYRQGRLAYEEAVKGIDEYTELIDMNMSEVWRNEYTEALSHACPEVLTDEKLRHDITLDMAVTCSLLSFVVSEYVSFHLWEIDFKDRLGYVTNRLKDRVFEKLNTKEGRDLLTNKYEAYSRLKKYYGREIFFFDEDSGYEDFKKYCISHKAFVKKDCYDSLGRGIEKIVIDESSCLRNIYDDMTENCKVFIIEDLIKTDERISRLNPDSVNTVRIITFRKGNKVSIEDAFMKVGRKGSFVDNGGSGGIFVHINPANGIFDSDGITEDGVKHKVHPEHGYEFKGIALPKFRKALKVAKAAAKEIDEAAYIGWDLTYTAEGKWIIVEGNSNTQFYGQQSTVGRGCRKEFLKSVGIEEREISELIE